MRRPPCGSDICSDAPPKRCGTQIRPRPLCQETGNQRNLNAWCWNSWTSARTGSMPQRSICVSGIRKPRVVARSRSLVPPRSPRDTWRHEQCQPRRSCGPRFATESVTAVATAPPAIAAVRVGAPHRTAARSRQDVPPARRRRARHCGLRRADTDAPRTQTRNGTGQAHRPSCLLVTGSRPRTSWT